MEDKTKGNGLSDSPDETTEYITPEQLFEESPDDALIRAASDIPVRVTVHGRDYYMRELPLVKAGPWEKKAVAYMNNIKEFQGLDESDPTKAMDIFPALISGMPDELAALVIQYLDLDEGQIEWFNANVTRSEIAIPARVAFYLGLPITRGEGINGLMPFAAPEKKQPNTPKKKRV